MSTGFFFHSTPPVEAFRAYTNKSLARTYSADPSTLIRRGEATDPPVRVDHSLEPVLADSA